MRVYLAVNITSKSTVRMIERYSGERSQEYAPLCEVLLKLDKLIDIVNAHAKKKHYPVDSPTSPYIPSLLETVQLFTEWKEEAQNANHFVPVTTYQDLCWVCFSTIGLAKQYTKADKSIKLDQGRSGSDDCEHRFCAIKAKGGTASKHAADIGNAKADGRNLGNTSALNMKAQGNSDSARLQRKDLVSAVKPKEDRSEKRKKKQKNEERKRKKK